MFGVAALKRFNNSLVIISTTWASPKQPGACFYPSKSKSPTALVKKHAQPTTGWTTEPIELLRTNLETYSKAHSEMKKIVEERRSSDEDISGKKRPIHVPSRYLSTDEESDIPAKRPKVARPPAGVLKPANLGPIREPPLKSNQLEALPFPDMPSFPTDSSITYIDSDLLPTPPPSLLSNGRPLLQNQKPPYPPTPSPSLPYSNGPPSLQNHENSYHPTLSRFSLPSSGFPLLPSHKHSTPLVPAAPPVTHRNPSQKSHKPSHLLRPGSNAHCTQYGLFNSCDQVEDLNGSDTDYSNHSSECGGDDENTNFNDESQDIPDPRSNHAPFMPELNIIQPGIVRKSSNERTSSTPPLREIQLNHQSRDSGAQPSPDQERQQANDPPSPSLFENSQATFLSPQSHSPSQREMAPLSPHFVAPSGRDIVGDVNPPNDRTFFIPRTDLEKYYKMNCQQLLIDVLDRLHHFERKIILDEEYKTKNHQEILYIKESVKSLSTSIAAISKEGSSEGDCHQEKIEELPLDELENVDQFDEKLSSDKDYRKKVYQFLNTIGGLTSQDIVTNILAKVFTNKVAAKFSLHGKNSKRAMKKLFIVSIIHYIVQKTDPSCTLTAAHGFIKGWLKNAGRRHKNEQKKENEPPEENEIPPDFAE